MPEKHVSFLLYLLVEILQFVNEIGSFTEVLYKTGILKNFLKFTSKHKRHSSGDVLSKVNLKTFVKFTENHLCQSLLKLQVGNLKLSEAATGDDL